MLNFSKQKKSPTDIKTLRSDLLDFIKEQLKKAESGEGENIRGLQLFIDCSHEDRFLYEGAVQINNQENFKEAIQKIADDYDIRLPANWWLQIVCDEAVPEEAVRPASLDVALFISTKQKPAVHKHVVAYLKVLNGEAEEPVYRLNAEPAKKINIGREKNVQVAEGYLRYNHIAFPADSDNRSNRSVSRQHAHIEWNAASGAFYLYADEGGIPPANKVKVKPEQGPEVKLITTEVGYLLKEGDQIILGESALLQFSYTN